MQNDGPGTVTDAGNFKSIQLYKFSITTRYTFHKMF